MDRKESIKAMIMGGLSIPLLKRMNSSSNKKIDELEINTDLIKVAGDAMMSPWHQMPDMTWTGANFWANRLQDWHIKEGMLVCDIRGPNRTVFNLCHQLENSGNEFQNSVHLQLPADVPISKKNRIGFRLGGKGKFRDYRSGAIYGQGLDVGICTNGKLFIGNESYSKNCIDAGILQHGILLKVSSEPRGINYHLKVSAYSPENKEIVSLEQSNIDPQMLVGNIGIISDYKDVDEGQKKGISCAFKKWKIMGSKFSYNPNQTFGPIYFAQYTQHKGRLTLTAQLAPVPLPVKTILEIKDGSIWKTIGEADVDYPSYTARFRLTDWNYKKTIPYRVRYELPLNNGDIKTYNWQGSIAKEPYDEDKLKALLLSCNGDMGFPDQEVVDHASEHKADVILFVGDQFYQSNGGFGIQQTPEEKAYLGYLRKWYEFGWSYRELFRHRPSITIPDDHDIWQGNYWGMNGKKAASKSAVLANEKQKPFAYKLLSTSQKKSIQALRQDSGGYTMPAQWVNLVYDTQTSHMPDPYDPESMKHGIRTFFTDWKYAGISMAIIEDREFKTAPKQIFPAKTNIWNAYVQNPKLLDWANNHMYTDAHLLGERQLKFLEDWIEDWEDNTQFKVWVSACPFHCLQTLPKGTKNDSVTPNLKIPKKGEYVKGDAQTKDMDTDGWPQNKRDWALKLLRKGFALHLTGDQHLASITQYGIDDWQDAGYQFTVPALGNIWPRRWWPPVPENHKPLPGRPKYTGNFKDGFDNLMHVSAVANPYQTGLKPAGLYDLATGYGVVTFDKKERRITMECWPRYINPKTNQNGQYDGWPVTIKQQDNFNPPKAMLLPMLIISGMDDPVVKVRRQSNNELVHVLRINGNCYQPKVLDKDSYSVEVGEPGTSRVKIVKDLKPLKKDEKKTLSISI